MEQRPHITVATVVEEEGRFLMVRERSDGLLVYNQPAGHLEPGESLVEAAQRETLEETAWRVQVTDLLGIYQYRSPLNGVTYIRHCFIARPIEQCANAELDQEIEQAMWLTAGEIEARANELRSPLVQAAVTDYLAGLRFPLTLISDF